MPSIRGVLSEKQETFAVNYYTAGSETYDNGTESARNAGYGKEMKEGPKKDVYLARVASELVRNCKVIARKEQIQAEIAEKLNYSLEMYQKELDLAKTHAQELRQPSAEVSAIVAKGRSMGYDKSNSVDHAEKPIELDDEDRVLLAKLAKSLTAKELSGPKLVKETG